ncbi:MAG: hypothetical protein AAGK04_02450 [Planctomycetota bacterium]
MLAKQLAAVQIGFAHALGVSIIATMTEQLFAPYLFMLVPIVLGTVLAVPVYCTIVAVTGRIWPVPVVAAVGIGMAFVPYQPALFGAESSFYKTNPMDDNWSLVVQVAVLAAGGMATGAAVFVARLLSARR